MNIEIDSGLQSQATETFAKIGLTLEEAVTIFLKASIRYGGLPFDYALSCDKTQAAHTAPSSTRGT